MTDAREKLNDLITPYLEIRQRGFLINDILAAFPQIAAPAQDARDVAREIAHRATHGCDAPVTEGHTYDCTKLTTWIAAAITAAEARVREECARAALIADSPYGAQTTAEQDQIMADMAQHIAATIRAGGSK